MPYNYNRVYLWSRLTRYRKWRGPNQEQQEQLDGTNNACERPLDILPKAMQLIDISTCTCPIRFYDIASIPSHERDGG